jgi:hypothetical protein
MRVPFALLGLLLLGCGGCASAPVCPAVPAGFLAENTARDLDLLKAAYEEAGFEADWVKPGSAFWVSHDEMPGKVVVEVHAPSKAYRLAAVYRKKDDVKPSTMLFAQVNVLNAKGVVKAYVDEEGDFWTETFYPFREGVARRSLMIHTRQFARYSREAAGALGDYLK